MAEAIPLKIENGTVRQLVSGDVIPSNYLSPPSVTNKLTSNLTVPMDTSYLVLSYFDLNGFDLIVNGNFGVLG